MSVIRRKIEATRPPAGATVTPARALQQAFLRAGQDLMGLSVRLADLTEARHLPVELSAAAGEGALIQITAAGGGRRGLVMLDHALVAALIEVQTTGRLGPPPAAPRRPTPTDAAIASLFVDAVLAAFGAAAEGAVAAGVRGFAVEGQLPPGRPLELALPEQALQTFAARIDLGPAGSAGSALREGRMTLAFPDAPDPSGQTASASRAVDPDLWAERLRAAAAEAPATLDAVLWRGSLPLAAILAFAPGTVVPIPADALDRIGVEGIDGRAALTGRLGQLRGYRAVRITAIGAGGPGPAGSVPAAPPGRTAALAGMAGPGEPAPDLPAEDALPILSVALPGADP